MAPAPRRPPDKGQTAIKRAAAGCWDVGLLRPFLAEVRQFKCRHDCNKSSTRNSKVEYSTTTSNVSSFSNVFRKNTTRCHNQTMVNAKVCHMRSRLGVSNYSTTVWGELPYARSLARGRPPYHQPPVLAFGATACTRELQHR